MGKDRGTTNWISTLTEEQKKELLSNKGFPDGGIYKPAVITEEDRKRMENNLLIAKEAVVANPQQQPFLEKHKKHLLLLLAVVAGYFAYKKFKK